MLSAAVYQPWIDLRATLCLLDPRQLADNRVVENENFRDQLAAADIIIANKQDRWDEVTQTALSQWQQDFGQARPLVRTSQGTIDAALLDRPRSNQQALPSPLHHHHGAPSPLASLQLNENSAGAAR